MPSDKTVTIRIGLWTWLGSMFWLRTSGLPIITDSWHDAFLGFTEDSLRWYRKHPPAVMDFI